MPSSFFCSCPAFFLLRPALFYTQAFAHWSCKPVPDPCLDNCPPAAEIQSHDLTLPGISPKMYFTRNVLHQRYRSHRSTLCCSNIATTFLLCDWTVWVWHTFMFVHPCIMHNFAEMFWCILLHLCTCAVQIILEVHSTLCKLNMQCASQKWHHQCWFNTIRAQNFDGFKLSNCVVKIIRLCNN